MFLFFIVWIIPLFLFANEDLLVILENQASYEFMEGNLCLFDAPAGDNQCHHNALYVTLLYKKWSKALNEEKGNIVSENKRYLALALLMSNFWGSIHDRIYLARRIQDTLHKTGNETLISKKKCVHMLAGSSNGPLSCKSYIPQARMDLAVLLHNQMINWCKQHPHSKNLFVHEELLVNGKYPSILLFLKVANIHSDISIVLKTKHICHHGTTLHKHLVRDNHLQAMPLDFDYNLPIVAIDAVASNLKNSSTFSMYKNLRKSCPHNFLSQLSTNTINDHLCINCDNKPFCNCSNEWEKKLMIHPFSKLMKSIAASFMSNVQDTELQTTNPCSKSFAKNLQHAEANGMCTHDISSLFIEHMYPTCGTSLRDLRMTDCRPELLYALIKT